MSGINKTNYSRVLPRDLFNEAKLLKCIGKLVLMIHDNVAPNGLSFMHDGKKFDVVQDQSDGSISIRNVRFKVGKTFIFLSTALNSKQNYPLILEDNYEFVFNENGSFTEDFLNYCRVLNQQ